MGWTLKANIKGIPGPRGIQGLPGFEEVPSDPAIAALITTAGVSETKTAMKAAFASGPALSFDNAQNATIVAFGSDPVYLDAIGDYLYATDTHTKLFRSTTEDGPWTLIHDFATGDAITGIRLLGDGEVMVARSTDGLWKSSGWAANPATATFTQKLVVGAARVQQFSWSVDPVSGWVACTTYVNGDMSASRYVWLSKNNGGTFTQIFDMAAAEPTVDQSHSHMHIAALDPYWNATTPRIWISYHKTTDDPTNAASPMKRIKYSDDGGLSWVTFSNAGYQPVSAAATPYGMVMGGDEGLTAIYRIKRTPVPTDMTYQLFHVIRDRVDSSWGWAQRMVEGPAGQFHIAYRSSVAGFAARIVSTDGRHIAEVLTIPPATAGDAVDFPNIVSFKGRLLGTAYNTVSAPGAPVAVKCDVPARGSNPAVTVGGVDGGMADALGTAGGFQSSAGVRGTAFGSNSAAVLKGTAVGESTTAGAEGTALGSAAAATVNGVALGKSASTDQGVAIGRNSVSVTDGTAVGPTANAVAAGTAVGAFANASQSEATAIGKQAAASAQYAAAIGSKTTASASGAVAIGRNTNATHTFAVAIGYGISTTAADQIAVGAKHILLLNLSSAPAAPAGGGAFFVQAGALKYIGSSGTVTTIAPA